MIKRVVTCGLIAGLSAFAGNNSIKFDMPKHSKMLEQASGRIEYSVFQEATDKISHKIKKGSIIQSNGYSVWSPSNEDANKSIERLSSESSIRALAISNLREIFPDDISDSCAITSIGFEMEQRDNSEPHKVGAFVRFHRLVDGLPIRGRNSFIEMEFDSASVVKRMEYRWPNYKSIKKKRKSSSRDLTRKHEENVNSYIQSLQKDISLNDHNITLVFYSGKETLKPWTASNGDVYLLPAVTYIGKNIASEKEEAIVFDVPVDESLLSDNLGDENE